MRVADGDVGADEMDATAATRPPSDAEVNGK